MSHQRKRLQQDLERLEKEQKKELRRFRDRPDKAHQLHQQYDDQRKKLLEALDSLLTSPPGDSPETTQPASFPPAPKTKKRRRNRLFEEHAARRDAAGVVEDTQAMEFSLLKCGLAERGLDIHSVPGDGNCLFRSVAHQLGLRGQAMTHSQLRKLAVAEMRRDHTWFAAVLPASVEEFTSLDDYVTALETTSAWGGEPELVALCRRLELPITTYRLASKTNTLLETTYVSMPAGLHAERLQVAG
ncbi:MAG: uncharacterized protein KVP18_004189 [Porospora cf. gigantea A]|uniref:uncharacterized protein n=1 Tax=Porospora cf. gigantea A TaxID=2853593 RepID=UPI00355ACCC0|nr:MAG: hypothetical protein KVP18_004189 [Porospora cf. gigantea A]